MTESRIFNIYISFLEILLINKTNFTVYDYIYNISMIFKSKKF